MHTIVRVEIVWSIQVFFLIAAKIPKPTPKGIAKIMEYRFTTTVAGSFVTKIVVTSRPK